MSASDGASVGQPSDGVAMYAVEHSSAAPRCPEVRTLRIWWPGRSLRRGAFSNSNNSKQCRKSLNVLSILPSGGLL